MVENILYEYMAEMLRQTTQTHFRYIYNKIDWRARMFGIVGPRGVGKSTMLRQHIKQHASQQKMLYVSADFLYFNTHTLAYVADEFVKEGGKALFIDEIHKYKNWSQELKQIYDVHPELHIVFTGSSILDLYKGMADLSRRTLLYHMQGLSFREYLLIRHNIPAPIAGLDDIINQKVEIPGVAHPLPLFREYLRNGYYPFSNEPGFDLRINQIVQQTIESDLAQYADLKPATARKLQHLLMVVATLVPFKPNYENLATEIGISKNNVADYLTYLEKSGLLTLLRDNTSGLRQLGKIEKVYLDNPNLMYALATEMPNIGSVRETFFLNQMRVNNNVAGSRVSDFTIGQYTFEVGGRKKGRQQIENVENGIFAKDDIETGHANIIPLWYFGMNY